MLNLESVRFDNNRDHILVFVTNASLWVYALENITRISLNTYFSCY